MLILIFIITTHFDKIPSQKRNSSHRRSVPKYLVMWLLVPNRNPRIVGGVQVGGWSGAMRVHKSTRSAQCFASRQGRKPNITSSPSQSCNITNKSHWISFINRADELIFIPFSCDIWMSLSTAFRLPNMVWARGAPHRYQVTLSDLRFSFLD
jgi:hypothetical protein